MHIYEGWVAVDRQQRAEIEAHFSECSVRGGAKRTSNCQPLSSGPSSSAQAGFLAVAGSEMWGRHVNR